MIVKPATLEAMNRMPLDAAERAACAIVRNSYGHESGVGSIAVPYDAMHPAYSAEYVNRGDTYDETLLRDPDEGWIVTSWGDWYENAEHAYAEESGETRCGYCGEWSVWERDRDECKTCEGFAADCPDCEGDGIEGDESTLHCPGCGHRS